MIKFENICRLSSVRDLGILFDTKFSFVGRALSIIKSAYRVVGFICRNRKDFKNEGNSLVSYSML